MKPSLGEDVTSILAITSGAAISAALTAALLFEEPPARAAYLIDVVPEPPSPAHIYFVPTPPVLMVGPEGQHSDWFPEETLQHEAVRGHRAPDRVTPSKRSGARREH